MSGKREPPFKLDMPFGEALSRYARTKSEDLTTKTNKGGTARVEPSQNELELVHYETAEGTADFTLDPSNETLWATQQQMADVFSISTNTVGEHLGNIFREGELDQAATTRKFRGVSKNGREINLLHYSLDAILSVGYRVSTKRGTAFRKWATGVLKNYLVQGFALNEARLKDDPKALRELAARVRALRADEMNVYLGVRDTFKFGASDYDAKSDITRRFYARLQDKFIYAVTGKTAAQIVLERADAGEPNMGLQSMKGTQPTLSDAQIGKNYLSESELYNLHIICEQFLLFAELRFARGMGLTMKEMDEKFDDLLEVQGVPIFKQYESYVKNKAIAHARRELELFNTESGLGKNRLKA